MFLYKHQIYKKLSKKYNKISFMSILSCFDLKLLRYMYFYGIQQKFRTFLKFRYFGHNLGQRRSKYRPNLFQNYLFGNSFTNCGNFELKLGQYLYYHGILHKIRTLFKIWITWTEFGQKKCHTWVLFGAKLPFCQ